ncbi:hypothetical protein ACFWN7_13490 [Agromyces sp. NPDC058484]|uniref:hypothetical protein n=1 Tax=Agromyces sp. NPDC058484 TaxID=3346524 RepID=UPI00365AEC34
MPILNIRTDRDERRQARTAVAAARKAGKESKKLAKTLKGENRARFELTTAGARELTRAAKAERRERPWRATRLARTASARLEKASIRATSSGDARRRALERERANDAKGRAKTIKRRRAQAKYAKKMARFVAVHTIAASITTPTDEEQQEKDLERARRRSGA